MAIGRQKRDATVGSGERLGVEAERPQPDARLTLSGRDEPEL
jgi:hypothetical protein